MFRNTIFKSSHVCDDTNLFFSNKEIKPLFFKANLELGKISEWFRANKLL